MNTPFVGVAGNIGVGKTTFTEMAAKHFGWEEYYESVIDNPYLEDFYSDMKRWSFNLQIYFLQHRFSSQIEISKSVNGVIQDRTIYEDIEIFARNLFDMKFMTKRDWETYQSLFTNMTQFLRKPDLIVYLKANTDTLINRIQNRNRGFEQTIDHEYLHSLNVSYEKWINRLDDIPVLTINTNQFNIITENDKREKLFQRIQGLLN